MTPKDKLADIIFISIPQTQVDAIGDFQLDPSILLPIDRGSDINDWNPEHISWEMIISGMLKVLAYEPTHEDADYFRHFVGTVKPGLVEELTEAGIIKARNQDFELAEEIFLAVLGIEPGNCRFLLNLALLYEDMARIHQNLEHETEQDSAEEKANIWYKRALSLDEVIPEAYLYAGHFFMRHHRIEEAQRQFESFLSVAQDSEHAESVRDILKKVAVQQHSDVKFKEAYDFIRMGQESRGIESIKAYIQQNPEIWNAWFLLGWGLRKEAKYSEAYEAFEKALKLGGTNSDTYNESAICAMELGKYAEAKKKLESALRLEPENLKIVSNMAILALKEGKTEEARAFFNTVIELSPDDSIARKYLEYLDTL